MKKYIKLKFRNAGWFYDNRFSKDKIYDEKGWVELKSVDDFKDVKINDFYVLEDKENAFNSHRL